jgi:hypothetical protein
MRRLTRLGFILFLFAATVPAFADHPAAATPSDLRQLRTEVELLDDRLQTIDSDHPRAREFREREGEIRNDLVWLRDEMKRHQENEAAGRGASKSEVDALRQEIRSLRNDIDASSDPPLRGRGEVSVPDGTEIQVRLDESVSSRTARPEDRVAATVATSVSEGGRLAIPAGTEVGGIVQDVEKGHRPSKGGRLELSFDSLVMDGQRVAMRSRVVRVEESGLDKGKAGLGALIGGVVGAVIDGKKGALIGALVGGTGAVVASSGDDVELPAGTVLTLRLERPLAVARR